MNKVDPKERLAPFAALIGDWSIEATHPAFGDAVIWRLDENDQGFRDDLAITYRRLR